MKQQDFARALVVDAIDTTGKIRENVAHLRDLGKMGIHGLRAAGQATGETLERMLEGARRDLGEARAAWKQAHRRGPAPRKAR